MMVFQMMSSGPPPKKCPDISRGLAFCQVRLLYRKIGVQSAWRLVKATGSCFDLRPFARQRLMKTLETQAVLAVAGLTLKSGHRGFHRPVQSLTRFFLGRRGA